eukprot:728926-Pyramimonas_sp.AAC.4
MLRAVWLAKVASCNTPPACITAVVGGCCPSEPTVHASPAAPTSRRSALTHVAECRTSCANCAAQSAPKWPDLPSRLMAYAEWPANQAAVT